MTALLYPLLAFALAGILVPAFLEAIVDVLLFVIPIKEAVIIILIVYVVYVLQLF